MLRDAASCCRAERAPDLRLGRDRRTLTTLLLFAVAIIAGIVSLLGPQEKPGIAPGRFDFWVLSLSWSPTYCRQEGRDDSTQCGADRHEGFVVHGLWPQYERGYPANCDFGPERIDRRFAEEMSDLMPSPGLVFHEWRKHGRCTGLTPEDYFRATRIAARRVSIPAALRRTPGIKLSPGAVEDAFAAANTGLAPAGMSISCLDGLLRDIRVCLDKSMDFRACPEVDADTCPVGSLVLPPAG